MKPISVWGLLGGHDGQRPMGKFGQDAGVHFFARMHLFFDGHPGIFNDHREPGPLFNVSSEGRCFLQYSVPITTLGRSRVVLVEYCRISVFADSSEIAGHQRENTE